MFLADSLTGCRPTELQAAPAASAAFVVHDLAALTPDAAARLDGQRCRRRVTLAGGADRRKIGDVWRD
ncbi:MAG TPA: hypothetical protein VMS17_07565 [Gemmataceae bacterium]|nr:hypothetical protein [Gemmataceae bacterium]